MLREDQLQYRVSQELKALIIKVMPLSLVPEAGVRQRLREQQRVPEFVADALFQGGHGWLALCFISGEIRKTGIRNSPALRLPAFKNGVADGTRTRNSQNHNLELYH